MIRLALSRMADLLCNRRALAVALVATLLLCYGDKGEASHTVSGAGDNARAHAAESITSCEASGGVAHDPIGGGFLSALSVLLAGLMLAALVRPVLARRVAPAPGPTRPPPLPSLLWLDRSRRAARLQVFLL